MNIRFYPLILMVFIWHLKCIYELSIVNPFWFVWPLPTDPKERLCRVIAIYLLITINIIYQLYIIDNKKHEQLWAVIIILLMFFLPLLGISYGHN